METCRARVSMQRLLIFDEMIQGGEKNSDPEVPLATRSAPQDMYVWNLTRVWAPDVHPYCHIVAHGFEVCLRYMISKLC